MTKDINKKRKQDLGIFYTPQEVVDFIYDILNIWKNKEDKEFWLNPLLYNVGIYLMTPILLGVFIGYSLDKFFKTKPIFVVFFIILGTISSFYNFWKIVKK